MNITRDIVLSQLTAYLQRRITAPDVYQWALKLAVSNDYIGFAEKDPLASEAVKVLMNIERIEMHPIGPHQALEYYRRCLAGELDYVPLEKRDDFHKLGIPPDPRDADRKPVQAEVPASERWWALVRGYVFFFGLAICGVFAVSWFNPDLLSMSGQGTETGGHLSEVIPQMIYAVMLMLPPRLSARGMFFYLVFLVYVLGAIYYWYIPIKMVMNYAPHVLLVLVAMPFSALPASLAVVLLIRHRELKT